MTIQIYFSACLHVSCKNHLLTKKLSLAGEESIVVMVEINSTDNWDQKAALTKGQSANHQAYHRVGSEDNDEKIMATYERYESSECWH